MRDLINIILENLVEAAYSDHLYHVTSNHGLKSILRSNELRKGDRGDFISLTRNKHWKGWNSNLQSVRLVLDKEVISRLVQQQGLQIGPKEEPRFVLGKASNRGNIDEREERIYGSPLTNIRSAIIVIETWRIPSEFSWLHEQHDLINLMNYSSLQKEYQIPFTYEDKPLVQCARELDYLTNDTYKNHNFWSGPYHDPVGSGPKFTLWDGYQMLLKNLNIH